MHIDFFNIIYNLLIYPFEFLIEITYFIFRRNDLGVIIILIGLIVSIVSIPLYNVADKIQKKELDLQKKLKPKIDEIKAVFSGDKRQMIIQTFYRINNYHPLYSLRGLFGLFIQIPIFIAAYHFISNLNEINGMSFGIIKDLAKPDGLINIGSVVKSLTSMSDFTQKTSYHLNLLPILMTVFNIASSIIHTRDLKNKERIPLFVMAAFFLVILYNSPSALLVYWTTTNLFSLIKNLLLLKIDIAKKVAKIAAIPILAVLYILFILVNTKILYLKPDAVIIINSLTLFSVLVLIITFIPYSKIIKSNEKSLFITSTTLLFVLIGLFIPLSLIASSPQEFKNIGKILTITSIRMFSLFFIYPLASYLIFDAKTKNKLSLLLSFMALYSLFNTFLFNGNYGTLNADLLFDSVDSLIPSLKDNLLNISTAILLFASVVLLIKIKKSYIIKNIMIISIVALLIISVKDLYFISKSINDKYAKIESSNNTHTLKEKPKIIDMSSNGKNVFILFMDRATAYYLPIIFENIPSMKTNLDGFVWYKGAISPSSGTLGGLFPILGGYDYTPLKVMERDNESLRTKFNEATFLLPQTFLSNGYITTLVYPSLAGWNWNADVSIFKPYSNIKAYRKAFNIDNYISDYVEINNDYFDIYLIRFALFRSLPMVTRHFVYNDGTWASPYKRASLNQGFTEYQYMKELTNIINIVSNTNTYTFFGNEMTHEPSYFNSDYKPSIELKNADKEDLIEYGNNFVAKQLYVNTAMLIEITNFVEYLKHNNIYDNTKIIVVSDHGGYLPIESIFGFKENIFLSSLGELNYFNALLMVKDFNAKGILSTVNDFITTADVPTIATEHAPNPVKSSNTEESRELGVYGFIITPRFSEQGKNTFNTKAVFNIKGNPFDTNNWKEITNYNKLLKK